MTVPSPKSRFLPTLTEVVYADNLQRSTEVREPEPAIENLALQSLTADLALELQGQLQAMLNAHIHQVMPHLHAAIEVAVKQAVGKAIAQYQLGQR